MMSTRLKIEIQWRFAVIRKAPFKTLDEFNGAVKYFRRQPSSARALDGEMEKLSGRSHELPKTRFKTFHGNLQSSKSSFLIRRLQDERGADNCDGTIREVFGDTA